MPQDRRPPSYLEMVLLPVLGAVAIESLHTRKTELYLFFLPFFIVGIRMFIAQFQLPPEPLDPRAAKIAVTINQLAAVLLFLAECGVVVASSPTTPWTVWVAVALFFLAYVGLRLLSRRYWIAAAIDPGP